MRSYRQKRQTFLTNMSAWRNNRCNLCNNFDKIEKIGGGEKALLRSWRIEITVTKVKIENFQYKRIE